MTAGAARTATCQGVTTSPWHVHPSVGIGEHETPPATFQRAISPATTLSPAPKTRILHARPFANARTSACAFVPPCTTSSSGTTISVYPAADASGTAISPATARTAALAHGAIMRPWSVPSTVTPMGESSRIVAPS